MYTLTKTGMDSMILILTTLLLLISGLGLSYLINWLGDVLPLTVEDPPQKIAFQAVCLHCPTRRPWRDFLLLRPCQACGQHVSLRFWMVLITFPIVFAAGCLYPPHLVQGWMMGVLIFYFYIVAVIDITHRIVLRSLTLVGWLITLGVGYFAHGLPLTLLGGATILVLMLLLFYAGVIFSKIMEKQRGEPVDEALGFGDVYISIMAGFLIAFPDAFSALILAILFGGLTSLFFLVRMFVRKDYKPLTPIPYAPFIILAIFVLMYRQG